MASVPISKTDLRNIISQLENYISLGGKVTAPTDTSHAEQNPHGYRAQTEAGEETIIIRIKL